MTATITLSKPIKAHNESLVTIELRRPTGEDIAAIGGFPFSLNGDGGMVADGPKMVAYVSRLGDIPLSSARQIDAADWMGIFGALSGFFVPAEAAQPTPAPAPRKITAKA